MAVLFYTDARFYKIIHTVAWLLLCISALLLFFVIPSYEAGHSDVSAVFVFLNNHVWFGSILTLVVASLLFLWVSLRRTWTGALGLALCVLTILNL